MFERWPRSMTTAVGVVALALLTTACGGGGSGKHDATKAPSTPAPSARENVTFYYQPVGAVDDLAKLGRVNIVVGQGGSSAAQRIKATGAKAYRYVQTYWFPAGKVFDGVDIAAHPDDAFCGSDGKPVVGRTDFRGQEWWFLDINERAVRAEFLTHLEAIRAQGWDGVFMDRGYAALTGIDDPVVRNVWNEVSTCTNDPVQRAATFADAYVEATRAVREAGLELMLNYGVSALDPATALRPDPHDSACVQRDYAKCRHLDDVWPQVQWALNEAISHPRDVDWAHEYESNRASEKDPAHGGQIVGLITQATLGGEHTRDGVYFEWSKVKLFKIPLAVGTGDDGCPGKPANSICNRQAIYPELANLAFGTPIDAEPRSGDCAAGSTVDCVWSRRYEHGASIANVQPIAASFELSLGVQGCRYVRDLWSGEPLAGNRCTKSVTLDVPAWSGRPLAYATKPW